MYHNMHLFIDEIKSWEGNELVVEKLEVTVEKFKELGKKIYQPNKGDGLNVLNHGDFHINNMLFKKDSEGKIGDVLFVSKIFKLFFFYIFFSFRLISKCPNGHRLQLICFISST